MVKAIQSISVAKGTTRATTCSWPLAERRDNMPAPSPANWAFADSDPSARRDSECLRDRSGRCHPARRGRYLSAVSTSRSCSAWRRSLPNWPPSRAAKCWPKGLRPSDRGSPLARTALSRARCGLGGSRARRRRLGRGLRGGARTAVRLSPAGTRARDRRRPRRSDRSNRRAAAEPSPIVRRDAAARRSTTDVLRWPMPHELRSSIRETCIPATCSTARP